MESRFYEKRELLAAVRDFERIVKYGEQHCESGKPWAHVLSVFFAMRAAFSIRTTLGSWADNQAEEAANSTPKECGFVGLERLPTLDAVRAAVEKLTLALASESSAEALGALREMGVLALCPIPKEQLSQM